MYEFGTDGIRGKANENLPVEVAYRLGSFLGNYYKDQHKGIVVGKDTRLSSSMFELALAAGISAHGTDVYLLGYIPTPAVASLITMEGFSCGVMISASHNPYYDNGLKVFSGKGSKLERAFELEIEEYVNSKEELPLETDKNIGKIINWNIGIEKYMDKLVSLHPLDLKGYHLALDTANGSASFTAKKVLERLGASIDIINDDPDGLNINTKCGSTHIEGLVEMVKKGQYDAGFAFDGDADRLIAVASDGSIIDGDKIIYSLGKYFKETGKLTNGKVVATVMANLGFFKKMEEEKIDCAVTAVGDKYVYQEMVANNYELGGEQSGHIIFLSQANTGDGLLTALNILDMMKNTGKSLNELTDSLKIYPQLLINVPVKNKDEIQKNPNVVAICEEVSNELGNSGRLLVRPSGTEQLIRVMVEASTNEECEKYVNKVVEVVKKENEKA